MNGGKKKKKLLHAKFGGQKDLLITIDYSNM